MKYEQVRNMSFEKRWRLTEYVVEATHEEAFALWKEFHPYVKYEQISDGWAHTIGSVLVKKSGESNSKEYPVVVECNWALWDGHLIAYYDACSLVVHHGMVRDYIDSLTPKGAGRTNAANFHHALHHCKISLDKVNREAYRNTFTTLEMRPR